MAQAILAILLASAMAAILVGRRVNNAVSQGRCLVPWILASASKFGGSSSPIDFAVFRLATNRYLVGSSNGKSAGLAPLLQGAGTEWPARPLWPGNDRALLGEVLRDAGYRVIATANADEAIRILEARDDIRIVITDVKDGACRRGVTLI
jgi:hypothetical protein